MPTGSTPPGAEGRTAGGRATAGSSPVTPGGRGGRSGAAGRGPAWGERSDGGAARICVILRDIPGAVGTMSGILGAKHANIVNLQLIHRDGSFHTFHSDVEVHDLAHLHAIVAALRDADPVSSVERI